jgi:hypothetical protein
MAEKVAFLGVRANDLAGLGDPEAFRRRAVSANLGHR